MARKDQEYTLGLFHMREHTIVSDENGQRVVNNFPIRKITSRLGPIAFSEPTGYSIAVEGANGWGRRFTQVVHADSGQPVLRFDYNVWRDMPEKGRIWRGFDDGKKRSSFSGLYNPLSYLSLGRFIGLLGFPGTRKAAARIRVRDLVTIEEPVGPTGRRTPDVILRRRPGFPKS